MRRRLVLCRSIPFCAAKWNRIGHFARKVVTGHLGVLQDLLLAFTLPVFTRHARRRMSAPGASHVLVATE